MIEVPLAQSIRRITRWCIRGLLIFGGLGIAVIVAAWVAAHLSSVTIDKHHTYSWRSGAAIYLAPDQADDVWCTATPTDGTMISYVTVPGMKYVFAPGREVKPLGQPVVISCDGRVTVSSGPVLVLFRLASPTMLLNSLVGLIVGGFWRMHDRYLRPLIVGGRRPWPTIPPLQRRDRLR